MEEPKHQVYNKLKSKRSKQSKLNSGEDLQTRSNRSKIKGKWRNSEHMQFIECFRKHGTNWDKLEKSVPTRTSLQVRTHAQKFFEKITNNYKVDNPVEFYLKNLRNHQMDLDHNIEEQLQNPRVSIIQKQVGPRNNEAVSNKEQDEFTFERNNEHKNQLQSLVNRKRTNQQLVKPLNKLSDEHRSGSLSKPMKYFKDSSGNHHDASTGISSSYLCLNGGEILIKGNGIKTTAPCDIQNIRMLNGSEQTMICANQPVQITITPISQGQSANNSIVFNHNIGSFIPPSGSGMPEPDRRVMSSQSDSTNYQLIMGILENNYCLRDIRGMCELSSECRVSSLTSSGLNPNNRESVSYPSSSPFRVGQQESKPLNSNTRNNRKSNSEPMVHNRTNNNFFKNVDFQGKNSEGEIASKGSSQLSDNKIKSKRGKGSKPISKQVIQSLSNQHKTKGKWRNSEHMQFIECFRKHGTNWDKLEKSVPTRTSLQVRAHAQKFFEKITEKYKVDNPVEFYLKNLRNHQMDLDHNIEEQLQNPRVSTIQKQVGPRHNEAVSYKEQDEFTFERNNEHKNQHKSLINRKRTNKQLFKSSNKPSDEHGSGSLSKPMKYLKDSSGNHHDASTGISSSYLCLNGGEILIKGNGVKTTAPCDIQNIKMLNGSEQTMICANQPVQITITPISQGQSVNNSIVFNHNIGSFIPPSGSGMPEPDRRVMSSQSDSTNYQLIMGILENNYCLRDIRGMCGLSSECRVSSLTSSGLNPNNRESVSYPSSSPFRVGQQESKPLNSNTRNNRKSNSEPMVHNRMNNNFFKNVDFQGKNSEGEIASKGSSQLSG